MSGLNGDWTQFQLEAEVEAYGLGRIVKEHNRERAAHEETTKEAAFLSDSLRRVAEAVGIKTPMQYAALADNDEQTTVDLLIKHIKQQEAAHEETRRRLEAAEQEVAHLKTGKLVELCVCANGDNPAPDCPCVICTVRRSESALEQARRELAERRWFCPMCQRQVDPFHESDGPDAGD